MNQPTIHTLEATFKEGSLTFGIELEADSQNDIEECGVLFIFDGFNAPLRTPVASDFKLIFELPWPNTSAFKVMPTSATFPDRIFYRAFAKCCTGETIFGETKDLLLLAGQ